MNLVILLAIIKSRRYISSKSKYKSITDSKQVMWTKIEKKIERLVKSTWNYIEDKG